MTKISEIPDTQDIAWLDPAAATGQALVPSGSRAAPGIAFGADTNTGLTIGPGEGLEFIFNGAHLLAVQDGRLHFPVNPTYFSFNGQKLMAASGHLKAATSDFTAAVDSGGNTAGGIGGIVTNRGASGTVTVTLATGDGPPNGARIFRAMRVANHALRIEPHAGGTFMRADGSTTDADKYIELGSNGAQLEVQWDGTNWLCLTERGTLNVET